ncbi:hypothetical protein DV532_21400 [Pseudomonas sp. Leaf58]|nr:hypothetical protein DV532_21400 [Pseudomonas sp. Leaf58]KQN66833.1 hypothetical protein ASF02_04260 [Pseudomonas sp. Leaf58]
MRVLRANALVPVLIKQGGRARQAQAILAQNRCGSGLAPRSAARAALDLLGAEGVVSNTWRP